MNPHRAIPLTSPVYPLQALQIGWDGYWAMPPSPAVLLKAHRLWRWSNYLDYGKDDLPLISPAAGSVAFTWSSLSPRKELEIWLFDQPDYYAEWLLSVKGNDSEGEAQNFVEILRVISQYRWS